jgi:glucose-1-phosphate adenylyltransferase
VTPQLNMYDEIWPIRTYQPNLPPPKFVFGSGGHEPQRAGSAFDSVVCAGTIISGGRVERSIVGPMCRINSFANVSDSILFEGVEIGRHCRIRRAIVDKGVRIPPGTEIGFDLEKDRQRGFMISDQGIVTIAKTEAIPTLPGNGFESHRIDAAVNEGHRGLGQHTASTVRAKDIFTK